jgi:NADPH:quinone reductase-like Zn-dependent oxidoreductase
MSVRAWVIHAAGLEHLRLETREMPRPGPGEVLLRMRAACVALRDHKIVWGAYGAAAGRVPGGEGVGEIAALGEGVAGWRVGQRVSPLFVHAFTGERIAADGIAASSLGGLQRDGCFAEYMLADAAALVEPPEHLSDEQAATLPFAGLTAWCALGEAGGMQPGDWVVVQGTNGVMLHALQLAQAAGAQVIVTSNLRHFPARALASFNVEAQSPDEFLTTLAGLAPRAMVRILREQAAALKNPPLTVDEVLDDIGLQAPGFADLMRRLLGIVP